MTPALNPQTFPIDQIDQRVRLHDISWQGFESVLTLRGDRGGVRICYLQGELELMSPSFNHEFYKTLIGRLVEAYAEERSIELTGCGSWTVKFEVKERGVEPDECYVVGRLDDPPEIPDFAIEVVWTSGGIDKLEIYRGLGIPEVWIWRNGGLQFFALEDGAYAPSAHSRFLPDLDPALIIRCMGESSQTQAVRTLRAVVRAG